MFRKTAKKNKTPQPKVSVSYSKNKDTAWTQKGQRYYYGYKVHAATEIREGFILARHVTPANLSDTGELGAVADVSDLPKGTRIYADKGYSSKKNSQELRKRHLKDGTMDNAVRGRNLTE